MEQNEIELQRQLFTDGASRFDERCIHPGDEHFFALAFLCGTLDYMRVTRVLDIGAGTGRTLLYLKEKRPDVRVIGIEPVHAMREVGYSKGLSVNELIEGDATALTFDDGEFDLVCAFGVLHHIRDHKKAVTEMLRVARKAIFISDSNNFGQGCAPVRTLKRILNAVGLWDVADRFKTRGKGYILAEHDGLFYSYSVFNDYALIRKQCKRIHLVNTQSGGINPYASAGYVALLGLK